MFQKLLAKRFKVVVHHDTRVLSVFELVVAKNGSKSKEPVEATNAVPASPALSALDRPPTIDRGVGRRIE
jgi:uncharacterized protein (TIGR03435 family)